MQHWQSASPRFPYEAPEAEQLFLRFEEQFMQSTTYNADYNEVMRRGLDEDFE